MARFIRSTPGSAIDRRAVVVAEIKVDEWSTLREIVRMATDPDSARPDWHARAACRGVGASAFFTEAAKGTVKPQARAIVRYCDRCPVTAQCWAQAEAEEFAKSEYLRFGVWGGRLQADLRPMKRARQSGNPSPLLDLMRSDPEPTPTDPKAYKRAYRRRTKEVMQGRVNSSCSQCGTSFVMFEKSANRSTCGSCNLAAQRARQATPEARAKENARNQTPEGQAKLKAKYEKQKGTPWTCTSCGCTFLRSVQGARRSNCRDCVRASGRKRSTTPAPASPQQP